MNVHLTNANRTAQASRDLMHRIASRRVHQSTGNHQTPLVNIPYYRIGIYCQYKSTRHIFYSCTQHSNTRTMREALVLCSIVACVSHVSYTLAHMACACVLGWLCVCVCVSACVCGCVRACECGMFREMSKRTTLTTTSELCSRSCSGRCRVALAVVFSIACGCLCMVACVCVVFGTTGVQWV